MTIRPAGPGARIALDGLVERSTPDTLYRRFHGTAIGPVRRELDRIAAPTAGHRSWVAVSPDGEVRGTATLAWGPAGGPDAGFLVEDGWHRRGIGRLLFAALMAEARRAGVPMVQATVQADNERALRFLRNVAPAARSRYAGGHDVEVAIPVRQPNHQEAA